VIRRIRLCLELGQATVELAIIGPVLVGLFALTLQGGLVISDQVNLQHFAYEGAQWAVNNRTTATVTTVTNHIQDQICGNGKAIGASDGLTRLCSDGGLSINVSVGAATASTNQGAGWGSALGMVDNAEAAAPTCPRDAWDLVVTPASGSGAAGITLTAKLTGPAGTGVPGSTYPPVVDLSTLGMPLATSSGTPLWNPPTVSGSGLTSTMYIQTTSHTPAGTYNLKVSGTDQCGGQPANGPKTVSIGTSSGAAPVDSVPHIDGVAPSCLQIGVPSTLTINGQNFVSGATVKFDLSGVSYPTTFISSRQVTVAVTATTSDTDNVVLTNPDGTQAKLFSAVLNAVSCPGGTGNISGSSTACSAGAAAGYAVGNGVEYTVKISWNEHLIIPWITDTVGLSATEHSFCQ
jgi:hypothetical protein